MEVVGKSVNTISGYGGDGKSIKNIGLLSQSTFVLVQSRQGIILEIIMECSIRAIPLFSRKSRNSECHGDFRKCIRLIVLRNDHKHCGSIRGLLHEVYSCFYPRPSRSDIFPPP